MAAFPVPWPIHEARKGEWKSGLTDKTEHRFRWIAVEMLVIATIGLIFGFLGPFGTYAMPVWMRLAYWVIFLLIGYAIFRPVSICSAWLSEAIKIPEWVAELVGIAIAAIPMSFLIAFAISGMQYDPLFLEAQFFVIYVQCTLLGFGIYWLMRTIFTPRAEDRTAREIPVNGAIDENAGQVVSQSIRTTLHKRLPAGFPDQILALGVEDHYVRVHAPDQSEMILMRLSDAIADISEMEGLQVHRSWWVAKDAIHASKRDGRNLRLVLSNGLEVPVSRSNVGKLKQTGWI